MSHFFSINPFTEKKVSEVEFDDMELVNFKIHQLSVSLEYWKRLSLAQRGKKIKSLKSLLQKDKRKIAQMISQEMGKPIKESLAEVEKTLTLFDDYIDQAIVVLQNKKIQAQYHETYIGFKPLGIVLTFMPWNFPLWQFFRFAVPAWLSGNVILLKHSENTPFIAQWIQSTCRKNFSQAIVNSFYLPIKTLKQQKEFDKIFLDSRIRAVTFTGSSEVGRIIAQKAGYGLKKMVLELGGSDAYVVTQSADPLISAFKCVQAKLINNGQSCIAAKRFFVHKSLFNVWFSEFTRIVNEKRIGNPLDSSTDLGPICSIQAQRKIQKQISRLNQISKQIQNANGISYAIQNVRNKKIISKNSHLKFISHWKSSIKVPKSGYFQLPEFYIFQLSDFKKQKKQSAMHLELQKQFEDVFHHSEVFGPVGVIIVYDDHLDLDIEINKSQYGLGAVIFGSPQDISQMDWVSGLDVGMIVINDILKSDPRSSFGGVKNSGFGRELGEFGLYEFCNVQLLGLG